MTEAEKEFNFIETIRWVVKNYHRVVKEEGTKVTYKWEEALTPPPNEAAMTYMMNAVSNRNQFFMNVVPKFLGGEDIVSEDDVARDKKLVRTIRDALKAVTEASQRAGPPRSTPRKKTKKAKGAKKAD
jgi:hypothetical protein